MKYLAPKNREREIGDRKIGGSDCSSTRFLKFWAGVGKMFLVRLRRVEVSFAPSRHRAEEVRLAPSRRWSKDVRVAPSRRKSRLKLVIEVLYPRQRKLWDLLRLVEMER